MKLLTFLSFVFSLVALSAAQSTESSTEERNIAGFDPKVALSVIGIAAYGIVGAIHWTHFFRNQNNKYMLTLNIGMTCMVFGFVLRILYGNNVSSIGIYSIMTLFLLLSPCTFLAINYVLLSRLAAALGAEGALFIRATWVTKLFIWSDVLSFLLLSSGGGMAVSEDLSKMGHYISIVGLVLQIISYSLFIALLCVFGVRLPRMYPQVRSQVTRFSFSSYKIFGNSPETDWKVLYSLLLLSSVGIIVRCAFRFAEFLGGYDSFLATHEAYFYLLDALPLLLSMALYALVWPARFIAGANSMTLYEELETPLNSHNIKMAPAASNWRRTDIETARYG